MYCLRLVKLEKLLEKLFNWTTTAWSRRELESIYKNVISVTDDTFEFGWWICLTILNIFKSVKDSSDRVSEKSLVVDFGVFNIAKFTLLRHMLFSLTWETMTSEWWHNVIDETVVLLTGAGTL